ncbi:deoxyribodipyrimidine photo-lyase, partial [Herbidospora sp. RD11066]
MHWFRKDLRLHDNPSLCESLVNCRTFRAVYILDPVSAKAAKVSANRWKFLLECLTDLDKSLRKCGSRLHVIRGQPTYVLPKLFQ